MAEASLRRSSSGVDSNNSPLITYTRGLDLSGTRQGAGGIGGLLALSDQRADASNPTNYYYHADGNGNIVALLNKKSEVVARYLYDPFGNLIAKSGPMADFNRYRFSSKEIHPNGGLHYFGYRYYEPYLQRWLNQDPIGERGGLNLYQFVRNSPMNRRDSWGLWDIVDDYLDNLDRQATEREMVDDALGDGFYDKTQQEFEDFLYLLDEFNDFTGIKDIYEGTVDEKPLTAAAGVFTLATVVNTPSVKCAAKVGT